MAEVTSVPAGKKGIRNFLVATTGLRPQDGVTVRSATITPEEFTADLIVLGDATAPQALAGLEKRSETVTLNCWVVITRPGTGETAVDDARDRAAVVIGLVQAALEADRSAAGAVPAPAQITVATSGLAESPVSWDGTGARRAEQAFSLSWTAHI